MKKQGYKIPKVYKMDKDEFNHYVQKVKNSCPRGLNFFCDGTPNPIPKGAYKGIGKCEYYKNGDCIYFDEKSKGE